MKNKWSQYEKELLISYTESDDSDNIIDSIGHAHYMMYLEGNHPHLKDRTLKACVSMFYKLTRKDGRIVSTN